MTRPSDVDPGSLANTAFRHLFSLRLRNARWLVCFVQLIALSTADIESARAAVLEQVTTAGLIPNADQRMSLFIQPPPGGGAHGLPELCLTEAQPVVAPARQFRRRATKKGNNMNTLAYPACIRELYESEIFGEAASLALLKVAKSDHDRYHFGTLLQLETETKARLRPFLAKYGIPLTEDMNLSDVGGMVGAYQTLSFPEFAGAIKPVIQNFLSRFEEIARVGPVEDRDVLESMVRHETAILNWFAMQSEGKSEGSLDSMIKELQYPLPKP